MSAAEQSRMTILCNKIRRTYASDSKKMLDVLKRTANLWWIEDEEWKEIDPVFYKEQQTIKNRMNDEYLDFKNSLGVFNANNSAS
jgi:hypothetical protein